MILGYLQIFICANNDVILYKNIVNIIIVETNVTWIMVPKIPHPCIQNNKNKNHSWYLLA
jgi:hypothetical protein